MNTIGSHTSLGDLIQWNQPAASSTRAASASGSATTATTSASAAVAAQAGQQTQAEVPGVITSALAPSGSFYGIAPTTDSLLGNIGTSSALDALSQINATRTSSSQISPYASASDPTDAAVSDGTEAEQNSQAQLLASVAGLGGGSLEGLPADYFSSGYAGIVSTLAPSLSFPAA